MDEEIEEVKDIEVIAVFNMHKVIKGYIKNEMLKKFVPTAGSKTNPPLAQWDEPRKCYVYQTASGKGNYVIGFPTKMDTKVHFKGSEGSLEQGTELIQLSCYELKAGRTAYLSIKTFKTTITVTGTITHVGDAEG